jgi:SAM-dependent methyltransferase
MTPSEAFAGRLLGLYTGGLVSLMIELGDRTGLFAAAARGPATASELAERAGLRERYVREWLGAVVTAGIMTYDDGGVYTLPTEHAECLTGAGAANVAPASRLVSLLAGHVDGVATAFREGGGVPYDRYRPALTAVMDGLGRNTYDALLVDAFLPLAGDLVSRLERGIRAVDVGCGSGHCVNLMAAAFPASTFVGYDIATDAIEGARKEAAALGLNNATFEVRDVADLPADPPFDAAFAFDAIHDQAAPAAVLRGIHDALRPGGTFVMVDIKASSDLGGNVGNPFAPLLYSMSTLHCLTVSLASGGTGLGALWGEELARRMLAEAGFVDASVHDAPGDPLDSVYVSRRPSS